MAAAAAGVLVLAACAPVDTPAAGPSAPQPSITARSESAPPTMAPSILPTTTAAPTTRAPKPPAKPAPASVATPKPPPRPAPTSAPKPAPKPAPAACDPSYPDVCLKDGIGDYDCSSGTGDGPNYVRGPVRVVGSDPFGLDADHDGVGCKNG